MGDLLTFFADLGLDIQQYFFNKKKKKQRAYEAKHGLPKKRMLSPYMRLFILIIPLLFISLITVLFFNNSTKNTKEKLVTIKELLEKEKQQFNKYPNELPNVIRNNPMYKDLLKDAWENDFMYKTLDKQQWYHLSSKGKDGIGNTADDITIK